MKSFRISYPAKRVTHVRNVERGDELAADLTTNSGQLMYGSGTTLTMDRLMKIKKFDVKRVPVLREREEWVTREELERRRRHYDSIEVVDTRDIPSDDEDPCVEERELLAEKTLESDTPDEMESLLDVLESVSEWPDDDDSRDRLQTLSDDVDDLNELFTGVLSRLSSEEDAGYVTEVLSVLEGMSHRLESDEAHETLSRELVEQLQAYVDDREELRSDLLDAVHRVRIPPSDETEEAVREQVAALREESFSERGSTGSALEEVVEDSRELLRSDESATKDDTGESTLRQIEDHLEGSVNGRDQSGERLIELIDQLRAMLERLEDDVGDDLADRLTAHLKELLGDLGDGDSERTDDSPPDDPLRRLRGSLSELSDGNWEKGIRGIQQSLEASDQLDASPDAFSGSLRELRDLKDNREEVLDRLDSRLEGEAPRESLQRVFEGEDPPDVEPWVESRLSSEDMEAFKDVLGSHREWQSELWDLLRERIDTAVEDLPESELGALRETLMEVAKRIRVQPAGDSSTEVRDQSGNDRTELTVIREAIEDGDLDTLTRHSGLNESTIESVRELFVVPDDLNKWQDQFLESFKDIVDSAMFLSVVNQDRVSDYVRQVEDFLDNHDKPLELLIMDPDPGAFLLAHEYNVSVISLLVAKGLGRERRERERLVNAAALMDTGMAAVPESLFMKDGDLSKRGQQEIYKHPLYSEMFAERAFGRDSEVARLVREHHERRTGRGYPRRLSSEDQHGLTPLIAVADEYTAMLESRMHRDRLPPAEAMEKLTDNRDQHLDEAVGVLEERIGFYPNGTVVLLSSGEIGLVRKQSQGSPRNPRILVFTDEDRNKLDVPQPLDLTEEEAPGIRRVLKTRLKTGN